MQCRMCGMEFDEKKCKTCSSCGKCNCNIVHCPNCGYGNDPSYETEFKVIIKLKDKIKNMKNKCNYTL